MVHFGWETTSIIFTAPSRDAVRWEVLALQIFESFQRSYFAFPAPALRVPYQNTQVGIPPTASKFFTNFHFPPKPYGKKKLELQVTHARTLPCPPSAGRCTCAVRPWPAGRRCASGAAVCQGAGSAPETPATSCGQHLRTGKQIPRQYRQRSGGKNRWKHSHS